LQKQHGATRLKLQNPVAEQLHAALSNLQPVTSKLQLHNIAAITCIPASYGIPTCPTHHNEHHNEQPAEHTAADPTQT
jgi:hypothetical protein